MGIILSALAAAGDSGVQSINQNIEQQNRLELEDRRSQLEMQKAMAIANATHDMQNQQRTELAGRIALTPEETQGIIAANVNRKYQDTSTPGPAADPADALSYGDLTPEEIAANQPSQTQIYQGMLNKGAATGDVHIADLVKMNQQEASNYVQARLAEIKEKQENDRYELGLKREDTRAAQVDVNDRRVSAMFAKLAGAGATEKVPAEVAATKWYMDNRDDPAAMAAWDKVHESKSKNVVSIAADLMAKDLNIGTSKAMPVDEAYRIASTLYEKATARNGATAPESSAAPKPAFTFVPGKGLVPTGGK